ncbi:hypothetical protein D3C73_901970 [compost metagenome]
MKQVGVDQNEIADGHRARDHAAPGHQHHSNRADGKDNCLTDSQHGLHGLTADRGPFIGASGCVVAPRLMTLRTEVLDGLVIDDAVGRLDAGDHIPLVHLSPQMHLSLRDNSRKGHIGADAEQRHQRKVQTVEAPEDGADQHQFEKRRQYTEQYELQKELDAGGAPFDDARQPARLALDMKAHRQPVQVLEHLQRRQSDRPLSDVNEHQLTEISGYLGADVGDAIGGDQHNGHDHHHPPGKGVNYLLVNQRRTDADQLAQDDQGHRRDHPHAESRLVARP